MAASTEASSLPSAPANPAGTPGGMTAENVPKPFEGAEAIYPLDDARYAEDLKFFQKSTGIEDPLALKKHIFKIRDEAYKTFPYPCIWGFDFLKRKTLAHPFYPQVKASKQSDKQQKVFMELGSFVGVDLRQVVQDGWSPNNVLGVDIRREWTDLGHQLFNDGDRGLPFFLGDIFQSEVLDGAPAEAARPVLDLRNLKDLNPLKERVMYICGHQVFHLFPEPVQRDLLERCWRLLSPEPGAAIFGTQVGTPEGQTMKGSQAYMHSPKTMEKLVKEVLGENVKLTMEVEKYDAEHNYHKFPLGLEGMFWLHWSVERI
ncbi:hypothetical protein PGT21_008807 [Puccinia graminis f. sp. tritici]|uniref:Methyltransferase domain-containing protein n=1 Tax=Puccinia graminis f. sp. tritici TaxID=56615 RepID=A0A5B0NS36_PUCGR|nr:hypothetical protein PGTUg99_023917 [Puccinia graminis f. sp. tritici]KAA1090648.1 hypothetical protein PGT21_008807 [Puccinia graminis f. sp. tritici]